MLGLPGWLSSEESACNPAMHVSHKLLIDTPQKEILKLTFEWLQESRCHIQSTKDDHSPMALFTARSVFFIFINKV